jgi:polysaccharide biosynthesis transport protein
MATEYELTLRDYLLIMHRRAPYLIGIFVAGLLISVVVAFAIPPTYRATGTIMVESQKVAGILESASTQNQAQKQIQVDQRISAIKERVMTRDSLLRIANKYDLFKGSSRSLTSSELIEAMRDRIGVEPVSSDELFSDQRGKPTIAFVLSYEDKSPEIAYRVATDLTTLFMDWNIKLRTEGATEATLFLTQESDKLKLEVERLDKLVTDFKQQNSGNLPEQAAMRMGMITSLGSDIRDVERDYNATEEKLRSLEVDLDAAEQGMGGTPQSLPALKAEYTRLLATYNESYPDMRELKRKIETLENNAKAPESENIPGDAATQATYKIQANIAATKAQLKSLARQKKALQEKLDQNESAMTQASKVEQSLDALIRDRDNAQKRYDDIHTKQVNAQIDQSLENENRSERFTLLEPPIKPDRIFKPHRVKIIALGFFLAIASSVGTLVMMASFDSQIRGADALAHVLGYRPLVVVPYLFIQEEMVRRKRQIKLAIIMAVCVVVIIAVAVHFLYMPLNILLMMPFARY